MPFAQFGVDPDTVFKVMDELTIPADQLKKFQESKDGCVIGRKLADDKKLTVGSKLPLKGDAYPVDLDLTVKGIYDGPSNRDLRMCLVRFDYFDELFKRVVGQLERRRTPASARRSGNAGMIFIKCKTADDMADALQEHRRAVSEQRFSDANPDRGSVRQDVRGDARGLEGDDPHHRRWPWSSRSSASRAIPWRCRCASEPARWPS